MTLGPTRPRALLVATTFPPDAAVGTLRTLRLLQHLVRRQWAVDVLTLDPASYRAGTALDHTLMERVPPAVRLIRPPALRPFERLARACRRIVPRSFVVSATPTIGVSSPAARSSGRLKSLRQAASAAFAMPDREISWLVPAFIRAMRQTRGSRPDVIYSSGPPFTAHLVASLLAAAMRRPWVADFRDPWARAPWREDRFGFEKAGWAILERLVVTRADAVVFVTRANERDFVQHYGWSACSRFHVVANGCDPAEFEGVVSRRPSREFVLLHAGSLYGARNPAPLFRAVASGIARGAVDPDRFRLRFIGRMGVDGAELSRLIDRLGLNALVEFVPQMPRQQVVQEMVDASALLVVQPVTRVSVPGKLYEYFASGRPVLALVAPEGETADIVRRSGAGLAVPADDERAIEEALVRLTLETPAVMAAPRPMYDGALRAAELERVIASTAWRQGAGGLDVDVALGETGKAQQ